MQGMGVWKSICLKDGNSAHLSIFPKGNISLGQSIYPFEATDVTNLVNEASWKVEEVSRL